MNNHPAYTLQERREVPDYHGTGLLFRHTKSGAQVFHLHNDDAENMFAFAFATYPQDSTGVAHILEHTVLSGSETFPVKDPFLQLLKGSVNTFLNAMTYPDKTVYPAASPVARDLFNMMRVYGDAVFFPLLKPELFRQEGHRLQFDESGNLERTGVVYNEMKGNYSSHDSVVGEACFQSLHPDSLYGLDSGGDPAVIPTLTYEQFTAFHRRFYHPSNARIVVYGNIPTEEYLTFLDERFLSRFDVDEPIEPPTLQPRWSSPRRVETTYPLDDVEDLSERSSVTLNWLLFPVTEARRVVDAAVLSEILLGHSGSPLSRVLLESGLGQDLSPVMGLETDLHEAVFSVGLRGTDVDKENQIQTLILDSLQRLADEGLEPDAIEGALRRFEFSNREIKGGPNGMRMMRRALRGWMYGGSPYDGLAFDAHIEALRRDLAEKPRFFETMIRDLLVNNPHRSTVVVRPDAEQSHREAERVAGELSQLDTTLSDDDRERIRRESEELRALQETPDDPEELAKIPFLSTEDIPREVQRIPYERETLPGGRGDLFLHREFTNGILYVDLAFDFGRLSPREEALLNLLGAAFTEVGLPDVPHYRLNDEINLKTGGITAFVSNQTRFADRSRVRRMFTIRMRVLDRTWREGAELLERVIRSVDFSDHVRLEQLIDEMVQEMQGAVIPSGHYFAGLRAGAQLHELMGIEETLNGITQLEHLRELARRMAGGGERADALGAELRDLFSRLADPGALHVNLTGDRDVVGEARAWLPDLMRIIDARHGSVGTRGAAAVAGTSAGGNDPFADAPTIAGHDGAGIVVAPVEAWDPREFLLASAGVSYVAVAFPALDLDHPLAQAQDLLAHVLRTGPLWERVRMQGGAYGAFASSRATEGLFSFGSYRDPNTVNTLQAYRSVLDDAAAEPPTADQLDLAMVSVLGRELRPLTPRDAGFTNFRRRLHDVNDEVRQEIRDRLRAVTPAQVGEAAALLRERMETGRTVILGGSAGLDEWRGAVGDEDAKAATIPVYHVGV